MSRKTTLDGMADMADMLDMLDVPMFDEGDLPLFQPGDLPGADLDEETEPTVSAPPMVQVWRVLVVDDDPEVIAVSRLALAELQVDGRPISVVAAGSAAEARDRLREGNYALAILDVVMERPEAGLELARHLRTLPEHVCTRVVLRTGQPGVAPEEEVLRAYDINDYWPKTELTAHRMRTLVTGQIRSCRDLMLIERQRRDLLRVIEATESLFRPEGSRDLLEAILAQLSNLLPSPATGLAFLQSMDRDSVDPRTFRMLAANGPWRLSVGQTLDQLLTPAQEAVFRQAAETGRLARGQGEQAGTFGCFIYLGHPRIALMLQGERGLTEWGENAVELFCRNASTIFLNDQLMREQESLLRAVERFVPAPLMRLLGVADVRGLQAGHKVSLELSVLFADLHGFTGTAEHMSPEGVFDLVETTLAALTPAIEYHGGVIDKYLGDGLMALFPVNADPAGAVMEMHAVLRGLNRVRQSRGQAALQFGIGLHHGPVVLGALGHAGRLELTAISDTVNVAARVERLTRVFGCDVLATDAMVQHFSDRDRRHCRHAGMVPIRGRQGRARVYHFFGHLPDRERFLPWREEFEALIAASARGEADVADRIAGYLEQFPDDPAAVMLREMGPTG